MKNKISEIDNGFRQDDKCPWCNHRLTGAFVPGESHTPSIGDISVCIRCTRVSKWNKNFKLIKTDYEKLPIEVQQEIKKYQHAILQVN